MTAALTRTPRPSLYLVPGRLRPGAARPGPRSDRPHAPLPALAAELAAVVLGTLFAPVARRVAVRFTERAPLLARRGEPEAWAAAIVYLLAEESRLFDYDRATTRTSLARELQTSPATLRRRVRVLQAALGEFDLDLPDPDPDLL